MFQVLSHFERCPGFDKKRYVKKIAGGVSIGHFQSIKTDVLQIFSFTTGDKTEFLSPMMFSNKYITGI